MIIVQAGVKTPIYQQIYQQLRAEIETGVRPAGTRLESTRFLAEQLAVGRHTVEHAYQELVAEGYLVSKRGAGYVVTQTLPYLRQAKAASLPTSVPRLPIDFTDSYDHLALFPRQAWQVAETAARYAGLPHIQPANGDLAYRQQLAAFLMRTKGLQVTADQIVVTSGFNEAAGIIANVVPQLKQTGLAVANPIAPNARHVWPRLNVPVQLFDEQAAVSSWPTAGAYLLAPTHNFPTGNGLNGAQRQALAARATAEGHYVIELDTDGTLVYDGQPLPAVTHALPGQSFYYGNFDDTLGAAFCMGFLVMPRELVAVYQHEYGALPNRNSQWQQQILSHLIANESLERFLRQLTLVYRNRRQLLVQTVTQTFAGQLTPMGAVAGTFVAFRLPDDCDVKALIRLAAQAGVGLVDPDRCWAQRLQHFNSLVFSFRQTDDQQIVDGIDRLATAWQGQF